MANEIKVGEIAKEAGVTNQEIIKGAKDIDIIIKSASCKVTEVQASEIFDYIMNKIKPKRMSETKVTTKAKQKEDTKPKESKEAVKPKESKEATKPKESKEAKEAIKSKEPEESKEAIKTEESKEATKPKEPKKSKPTTSNKLKITKKQDIKKEIKPEIKEQLQPAIKSSPDKDKVIKKDEQPTKPIKSDETTTQEEKLKTQNTQQQTKETTTTNNESLSENPKQKLGLKRKPGLKIVRKNRASKTTKNYVDIDHGDPKTKTRRKSLSELLGNSAKLDDSSKSRQKSKPKKSASRVSSTGKKIDIYDDADFIESQDSILGEEVVLFDMGKIETSKFLEEQPKKKQQNGQQNRKRSSFGNRRQGISRNKPKRKYEKENKDEIITSVTIPKECRVYEFAALMGKTDGDIIGTLFKLGMVVNKNNFLSDDEIEILADEYGVEVTIKDTLKDVDYESDFEIDDTDKKDFVTRPAVVTIMGHVDHGKTTLLDKIRNSRVAKSEAGNITQNITAYTVTKNGKEITFVDTPGHEAFMSMRTRGAGVTDIIIIVVAGDDGVKPQTIESIKVAKKSNSPIIVAVNKMDKEQSNLDMVKSTMSEHGITPTDWGGDVEFVPLSAMSGDGIDDLLDIINIQAEIMELKASPNGLCKAVVLESSTKKGRGAVASVIVQSGSLKIGDAIVADTRFGKIKSILNDKGETVKELKLGWTGEVVGLDAVPDVGVTLVSFDDINQAKKIATTRYEHARSQELSRSTKVSLDEMSDLIAEGKINALPIVLKADTGGSLEAIKTTLENIKNEEVKVKIISSAVGGITQTDLDIAKSGENCIIIGFNVRPTGAVKTKAKADDIEIKTYSIIYDLIDDIRDTLSGMMSSIITQENTGQAQVLETFVVPKIGTVAGTKVTDGKVIKGGKARVIRDGVVVYTGNIASLKRFKDDVKEVKNGFECGIIFEKFNDILVGDFIETFIEHEEARRIK